jgi:hypothetical protein
MNIHSLSAFTASMPMDWLVLGVFAIIMIVLTLRSGPRIACTFALALPLALFLFQTLSSTVLLSAIVGQFASEPSQSALFGLVFVVSVFLSFRIVGPDIGGGASPVQSILVGLAATAIALVFWLDVPALSTLWHFGSLVQSVFAPMYRLWWMVGGLLMLTFARF